MVPVGSIQLTLQDHDQSFMINPDWDSNKIQLDPSGIGQKVSGGSSGGVSSQMLAHSAQMPGHHGQWTRCSLWLGDTEAPILLCSLDGGHLAPHFTQFLYLLSVQGRPRRRLTTPKERQVVYGILGQKYGRNPAPP